MASPFIYTNGLGGSSGAELVSLSPLYTTGDVWFVHSGTGTDAVSPRGKERLRPLASLSQAHTNAAAGDMIVMLSGHTETLASTLTLSKAGLTILGEGLTASRPKLKRNVDNDGVVLSGAGIRLENIYFQTDGALALTTGNRVSVTASHVQIRGCYFEIGVADVTTNAVLNIATGLTNIFIGEGTEFINSGAGSALLAVRVAGTSTDLQLETVTFDGGSSGWAVGSNASIAFSHTGAATRLRAKNVDLLNGSDFDVATGSAGYLHVRNRTGSSRVVIAA